MKVVAVIIAVILVLAVVNGFDLSVFVVDDFSSYPDLPFDKNVSDLSSFSSKAISDTFVLFSSLAQVVMSSVRGESIFKDRPDVANSVMIQAIKEADVTGYDGPYLIQWTITAIKAEIHVTVTGFFLKSAFWELVDNGFIDDVWS